MNMFILGGYLAVGAISYLEALEQKISAGSEILNYISKIKYKKVR